MQGYRNNEPTSREAMLEMIASGALTERRAQVYWLVDNFPGHTAVEYGRLMVTYYPQLPMASAGASPHKRLPELQELGYVTKGDTRKCRETGKRAYTWYVIGEVV